MHLQLETEFNVEPAPTFLQHSLCWWICVWNFWIRVLTLVSWTEFGLHAYCAVFWSICSVGFLMVFNESFMKCPGLPLVTQSTTQSCTLSAYSLWLSLVCNLSLGPHKINLILHILKTWRCFKQDYTRDWALHHNQLPVSDFQVFLFQPLSQDQWSFPQFQNLVIKNTYRGQKFLS